MKRLWLVAILLVPQTAVAVAVPLPKAEEIVQPDERPLLSKLLASITRAQSQGAEGGIATLDALLPEIKGPTPLRGLVQFFRGAALAEVDRTAEAREAVRESIALLPNYSAPLLLATQIHAYSDQPGEAADYLIRASRIDPELVRTSMDQYEIENLTRRLTDRNDRRRHEALTERLLEIGWSRGDIATMSEMASAVLDARLRRADVAGAAQMIPRIVLPGSFVPLLTDKHYEALRPAAETWVGSNLEKQWAIYLAEARAAYEASGEPEAARSYAAALSSAGHHNTLIATFLPAYRKPMKEEDYHLIYLATPLAEALAIKGRWAEADKLFETALEVWPLGKSALALNLAGNRARYRYMNGNFAAAAADFDAIIKDAGRWGGEASTDNIAAMHYYRACTLAQLGRAEEELTSSAIVITRQGIAPVSVARLHLCRNDSDAAREALIAGLDNEATRSMVIGAMQPADAYNPDSVFWKAMTQRWEKLKSDPKLLAEVAKHGRILPRPINASAPREQPPAS